MTNPVLDLLTRAQNLIRDPNNWTQHTFARDAGGEVVSSRDDGAICWCSLGALYHTIGRGEGSVLQDAEALLDRLAAPYNEIAVFNDKRTHEEVMAIWDRARELAGA